MFHLCRSIDVIDNYETLSVVGFAVKHFIDDHGYFDSLAPGRFERDFS